MTVESMVSVKTLERSSTSASRPVEDAGNIPDYREPPVGFFEAGVPGSIQATEMQRQAQQQQQQLPQHGKFPLKVFSLYIIE